MADVTQILAAIEQGDPHAAADLLPLVYDELRKLAAARLAAESSGHTLQPTALVHDRTSGGEWQLTRQAHERLAMRSGTGGPPALAP
jgi:ECF sigma factor